MVPVARQKRPTQTASTQTAPNVSKIPNKHSNRLAKPGKINNPALGLLIPNLHNKHNRNTQQHLKRGVHVLPEISKAQRRAIKTIGAKVGSPRFTAVAKIRKPTGKVPPGTRNHQQAPRTSTEKPKPPLGF